MCTVGLSFILQFAKIKNLKKRVKPTFHLNNFSSSTNSINKVKLSVNCPTTPECYSQKSTLYMELVVLGTKVVWLENV